MPCISLTAPGPLPFKTVFGRTHYRRCDHPRDVCLLLDAVADAFVAKKKARKVTMQSAIEILKKANQSGLVQLALCRPDHEIFCIVQLLRLLLP